MNGFTPPPPFGSGNDTSSRAEDFDRLLKENAELRRKVEALQNEIREKSRDFYGLSWIDVPEAFEEESKNKIPVLEEVRDKAVKNADGKPTHILIEGDNYHALTCLNYTHRGKIDVIYIDPPYNTGNDGFTYKDARFLTEFPNGAKIDKNHPLRHSAWLSFMAKRLELAKNLLSERGVIFISIDDNEQANLKLLCNEVFGEENFLAQIIWERAYSPVNLKKHFSENHDFVLVYSRSILNASSNGLPRTEDANSRYSNPDNDSRGPWKSADCSVGPVVQEKVYPIKTPSGRIVMPPRGRCWLYTKERFQEMLSDNRVWFGENGNNVPAVKKFLSEVKQGITPLTIWKYVEVGHSQDAAQKLKDLFGGIAMFAYPKPIDLIKRMEELYSRKTSIILDFFAGSGTTMHATMKLNAEDGGTRQCILVTNNENQICEKVTYERNRRVMCGYVNSKGENVAGLGNSMKYYRTAFVGGNDAKNALDRDKKELSRKAGALLSLAENTLEEQSVPEAEAAYFQIFSDGKYRFTAVYFTLDWTHLDALARTLKTLSAQTRGKARFAIYVYCDGAPDIFEKDLADVPGATHKAIPQPILEIYKTINGGK